MMLSKNAIPVPDGHFQRATRFRRRIDPNIATMGIPRRWPRIWLIQLGFIIVTVTGFSRRQNPRSLSVVSKGHSTDSDTTRAISSFCEPTRETIIVPPYIHKTQANDYQYPSLLHKIHIRSILNETEAATCLALSTDYASITGCWDQPDYERHASYATCDFAVDECGRLLQYMEDIDFSGRIFNVLSELYNVPVEALSFLDLFCAHYQAKDGDGSDVMDRLEPHRDGSLLSFVMLLTPPEDFEGGGTYIDALRDVKHASSLLHNGVIRLARPGDATIHSGKLLHGGDVVTKGERTVLVGFVEVDEVLQRQGTLSSACRDFGRMDVATRRYERQKLKTSDGSNGWIMNNDRWLPSKNDPSGRSILRGFCPAFAAVERRADPIFQRKRRLEAEDMLLRSILLDESEREEGYELFAGDVSIL